MARFGRQFPVPRRYPPQQKAVVKKYHNAIDIMGGNTTTTSTTAVLPSGRWKYNASDWSGDFVAYLEILGSVTSGGTASYQLYNVTDSVAVGEIVTTTGTTVQVLRGSQGIQRSQLIDGKTYAISIFTSNASFTNTIQAGRLVFEERFAGAPTTRTSYIKNSIINSGISNTSYQEGTLYRFTYDSSKWDGSPTFYLEGSLTAQSTFTTFLELYNVTDSATVSSSEISTTATSQTCVRSGAITLTDGKEYSVRYRVSGGTTGVVGNAHIVVKQTNPTKWSLHRPTTNTGFVHSSTTEQYQSAGWNFYQSEHAHTAITGIDYHAYVTMSNSAATGSIRFIPKWQLAINGDFTGTYATTTSTTRVKIGGSATTSEVASSINNPNRTFIASGKTSNASHTATISQGTQVLHVSVGGSVPREQTGVAHILPPTQQVQTGVASISVPRNFHSAIDQQYDDFDAEFAVGKATGVTSYAQSFTPTKTAALYKIGCYASRMGQPDSLLRMSIYTDSGGVPGQLVVTADDAYPYYFFDINSAGLSEFAFGSAPYYAKTMLDAGVTYWIVWDIVGTLSDTDYYQVHGVESDFFAGGMMAEKDGTWASNSGYDIGFIEHYIYDPIHGHSRITQTRSSSGQLDQSFDALSHGNMDIAGFGLETNPEKAAQSFKPSVTAPIFAAEFWMYATWTVEPTDAARVQIYTDNAGEPGTLVATSTDEFDFTELPYYPGYGVELYNKVLTRFHFSGVTLTAETTYWFVISRTGTPTDDSYGILFMALDDAGDPYDRGKLQYYSGAWGDPIFGYEVDSHFNTYYLTNPQSGVARIKATYTNTHSADAYLRHPSVTISHATDSLKRTATTATHTLDANKRKINTSVHTADSNKRKATDASHTTDSLKRKTFTTAHTTDSLLREQATTTHSTDSNKRKATIASHTTDANKKKATVVSHTTDANKRAATTVTHTTDSNRKKETVVAHTTDSNKRVANNIVSHATDALKRKLFELTHTTDALIRSALTLSHSTDSFLRKANTASHTTDANKKKTTTASHTTDANKKKADNTVSHSTDANKRVSGNILTHTTDALKRKSSALSHTADSLLRERYPKNKVHNGSFETGTGTANANFSVPNWALTSPSSPTVITVSNDASEGSQAIQIAVDATNSNNGIKTTAAAGYKVAVGGRFRVLVSAKSNTAGQMQIQFRDQATGGNYLQADGVTWNSTATYFAINTTTSYQQFTVVEFTAPSTGVVVVSDFKRSGASSQANKTFTIDDVQIVSMTWHYTDSFLRKSNSISHSTDSLKRAQSSNSHTTDTNKKTSGLTLYHASDANKRTANVTRTHTTDSFLRDRVEVSHSTDSNNKKTNTASHSIDAFIRSGSEIEHSTDANRRKVTTVSHSTDANKKKANNTASHSTDSILREVNTLSHATDANRRKESSATHTTDSLLRQTFTSSHTTDSFLRKSNTLAHTSDALLRESNVATHTADSNKRKANELAHTTDANKRKATIVSHTTDANKRLATALTHTADANKRVTDNTISHASDSLLRETNVVVHATDALKRTVTAIAHTVDSFLRKQNVVSHTTDSNLKKSQTRSHVTDAFLRGANQVVHNTDANRRKAGAVSHTTDASKKVIYSKTHTTDSNLRDVQTVTHSTDGLIRKTNTVSHTTDARLKKTHTVSHTTDSMLRIGSQLSHSTDANKKSSGVASHTTDTVKRTTTTATHLTDALLRERNEASHTVDSLLRNERTVAQVTDANKRKSNIVSHTTSSVKRQTSVLAHTTDAFKKTRSVLGHTVDAFLRKVNVLIHSTSANKKRGHGASHSTDTIVGAADGIRHITDASIYTLSGTKKVLVNGIWVTGIVKYYDGVSWKVVKVYYWNGSSWVETNQ